MKRILFFVLFIALCCSLAAQQNTYDVIISGTSPSGIAAAKRAAKLGAKVLLLGEHGLLGGQLLIVSTMDDSWFSIYNPSPFLREFKARVNAYYHRPDNPNAQFSAEPKVVDLVLRQMIAAEPNITLLDSTPVLSVNMNGNLLQSLRLNDGRLVSGVVIDATEYGDIIRMSGAEAYAGNGTDKSPGRCVQNITWPAVVRHLPAPATVDPDRVPACEQFYLEYDRLFSKNGGADGKWTIESTTNYRLLPNGLASLNQANDHEQSYIPELLSWKTLSSLLLTDMVERQAISCQAKLKTACLVHYIQAPFGLNRPDWDVASDAFAGSGQSCPIIPPELKSIESAMPSFPYIRESLRITGMETLTSATAQRQAWPDGVFRGNNLLNAVGVVSYMFDHHGCLDDGFQDFGEKSSLLYKESGPYQFSLGHLIPIRVDGLIAAETHISSSRLTTPRVQPDVISVGESAGTVAAIASLSHIQPRQVDVWQVQHALVKYGTPISLCSYDDVPYPSSFPNATMTPWEAVQLTSTLGIMAGTCGHFNSGANLTRAEMAVVITQVFGLTQVPTSATPSFVDVPSTHWAFPLVEAMFRDDRHFTVGCQESPRKFCPDDTTTREQLSVFLGKGLRLSPSGTSWLAAMQQAGIMESCSTGGTNCASDVVSRIETALAAAKAVSYIKQQK